ncbi:PAQR family membrane homeostasis protein TrhA [Lacisediminihabitans changchengi]|uniref:Hemolysin III family protein n=1 Tax=Lacisediminihabitans changchengi TaxID=2787634 RepID=A0A934SSF2_9MICO|nr:hemolysin III family protein [Lacisediminihabitans changchengi]MBK4347279.1 hemolysin III family protein [Lacisediminihabitans changchengi]
MSEPTPAQGKSPDPITDDDGPDLPNIPLLEDAIDSASERPVVLDGNGAVKPTWRGWIHAGTFPLAVALGIVLIVLAHGVTAKLVSAVFVLCSMLLFGISALYHRINWQPKTRRLFKRLDHANIFLLIAGSYTPITVLALPPNKAVLLICLVWGGALLGILFRIFWIGAPRWLYVPLYLLLGYAAFAFIADFFAANAAMMTLILVGGLFYSIGAVVYAFKRPNPFPGRFGFHEIFHALTLLAFLCHWVAILIIATNPTY